MRTIQYGKLYKCFVIINFAFKDFNTEIDLNFAPFVLMMYAKNNF